MSFEVTWFPCKLMISVTICKCFKESLCCTSAFYGPFKNVIITRMFLKKLCCNKTNKLGSIYRHIMTCVFRCNWFRGASAASLFASNVHLEYTLYSNSISKIVIIFIRTLVDSGDGSAVGGSPPPIVLYCIALYCIVLYSFIFCFIHIFIKLESEGLPNILKCMLTVSNISHYCVVLTLVSSHTLRLKCWQYYGIGDLYKRL
jgi:hypothetical protein